MWRYRTAVLNHLRKSDYFGLKAFSQLKKAETEEEFNSYIRYYAHEIYNSFRKFSNKYVVEYFKDVNIITFYNDVAVVSKNGEYDLYNIEGESILEKHNIREPAVILNTPYTKMIYIATMSGEHYIYNNGELTKYEKDLLNIIPTDKTQWVVTGVFCIANLNYNFRVLTGIDLEFEFQRRRDYIKKYSVEDLNKNSFIRLAKNSDLPMSVYDKIKKTSNIRDFRTVVNNHWDVISTTMPFLYIRDYDFRNLKFEEGFNVHTDMNKNWLVNNEYDIVFVADRIIYIPKANKYVGIDFNYHTDDDDIYYILENDELKEVITAKTIENTLPKEVFEALGIHTPLKH